MIEEGLRTALLAESTVTTLVTNDGGELLGIYVDAPPQGARPPYVLLTNMGDVHNETLGGGDGSGAGALHFAEIDVDCKASAPGASKALAKAVDDHLADLSGTAGDETVEAVVRGVRNSSIEPPTSGEGHPLHVETTDYQVQYRP